MSGVNGKFKFKTSYRSKYSGKTGFENSYKQKQIIIKGKTIKTKIYNTFIMQKFTH